jgi:hypothetical protein
MELAVLLLVGLIGATNSGLKFVKAEGNNISVGRHGGTDASLWTTTSGIPDGSDSDSVWDIGCNNSSSKKSESCDLHFDGLN